MDYRGKKIAITGASGFIGSALVATLQAMKSNNVEVNILEGDVRHPATFAELDHSYDYLFHFGAPSSQVLFKRSGAHCIDVTMTGFMNAAAACARHGIRLVYPSTGLLSSGRFNEYAMVKKLTEDYAASLGIDSIGVRIFATYGPGESHKRDYASVPYLFARDMVEKRRTVLFGDGNQVRDFIYIDDTVQGILNIAERATEPIVDLGSGVSISFNTVLDEIARHGKVLPVKRVDSPKGYVHETHANLDITAKYYVPKTDLREGIAKLVKRLRGNK